jgi:hypothetical protein
MAIQEQFENETGYKKPKLFGSKIIWKDTYIKWLENKLETLVQQPLSGSDGVPSSPKVATQPSDNGKRCLQ